jgi:lipopolysaccharide/colanic/teichoic acid biosynthesis glycosyltransferase
VEQRGWRRGVKRAIDCVGAGAGLLALSPVLAGVAVAVRREMGSPVLFRQERAGKGGEPFLMYKFRTMRDARDAEGRTLPDAERLTPLGQWLRETSLDELPELWNVLRGDMSLVGPRPLLMAYNARYSATQRRRLDVLPGLTGWAQIHGRNALAWSERFALDVWYVDHWSPWLDVEILLQTVRTVVRREGISHDGHVTMPEFRGAESA